jgi:hypothetical protein
LTVLLRKQALRYDTCLYSVNPNLMKTLLRYYRDHAIFALFISALGFLLYAIVLILIIIFFVMVLAG